MDSCALPIVIKLFQACGYNSHRNCNDIYERLEAVTSENYKIRVKNLTKSYHCKKNFELPVLDNISFSVNRGDFYSIVGPSGCGKTTTLQIIAGIEQMDKGSININHLSKDNNVMAMIYF